MTGQDLTLSLTGFHSQDFRLEVQLENDAVELTYSRHSRDQMGGMARE